MDDYLPRMGFSCMQKGNNYANRSICLDYSLLTEIGNESVESVVMSMRIVSGFSAMKENISG